MNIREAMMSTDESGTGKKGEAMATGTSQPEHEKVPEGAENIEHTLRRLNAEKARKREKNPGLYL